MRPSELDMNKIAKMLGAKRRGKVRASGGYLGALELAAEVGAVDEANDDTVAKLTRARARHRKSA